MLRRAVVVSMMLGCAPAPAEVVLAPAPPTSVAPPSPAPPWTCNSPKLPQYEVLNHTINDLVFHPCDAFVREFDDAIGVACAESFPPLTSLLFRGHPTDEELGAMGSSLLVAGESLPADVDYSRDLAGVPSVTVSAGLERFARGLSAHLTPLGRHYLRKYVVCRALADAAARSPDVRRRYADVLYSPKDDP